MKILFWLILLLTFASTTNAAYEYDAAGNLTSDGVYDYLYNDASLLKEIRVKTTNIVKAQYFYDHSGARIKKIEDGNVCYYISAHSRSCDNEIETSIFLQDERVAKIDEDGEMRVFHNDHLGSPFAITDKIGNVVNRLEYSPYGKLRYLEPSTDEDDYTFSGKELDSSGNYYFEARYMSSLLQSFMQPDPLIPIVGNTFSLNPYHYASNSPINRLDLNGKSDFHFDSYSSYSPQQQAAIDRYMMDLSFSSEANYADTVIDTYKTQENYFKVLSKSLDVVDPGKKVKLLSKADSFKRTDNRNPWNVFQEHMKGTFKGQGDNKHKSAAQKASAGYQIVKKVDAERNALIREIDRLIGALRNLIENSDQITDEVP